MPRVLAPPSTSVAVPARHEPDDDMEVSAEAGISSEHGASAPITPPAEGATSSTEGTTSSTVSAGGAADVSVHGTHVTKEMMQTKVVTAGHPNNRDSCVFVHMRKTVI